MLIVEDGTLPVNADAYISLADADAYLLPRQLWAITPEVTPPIIEGETPPISSPDPAIIAKKESCIIRATDYLNTLIWRGNKVDSMRIMAFPRLNIPNLESSVVPLAVARACAEVAALYYKGTDLMAGSRQGIVSESSSVDVISESVTYDTDAPSETFYRAVIGLIRPYLLEIEGEKKKGFTQGRVGRG